MFDLGNGHAEALRALVGALCDVPSAPDPRGMLAQVEALERLKSAAAAAQARITADFDDQRQAEHPTHAVPDASLGAEVGIARHQSPHSGRRKLHLARALVDDLPATLAALARGDIDERRAEIIATETGDLRREDRQVVDAEVAAELRYLGDRDLQLLVQRLVYRIDDAGAVRRREKARSRRRVSGRRLGDGTMWVAGLVSDIHGQAILNSLGERVALEKKLWPDHQRTDAQRMADLFVERLTGQATATSVPVTVDLVVSAETLFGEDVEPGHIVGLGPVPASVAREMVKASPEQQTRLRRLFRVTDTDRLVAMDSVSRTFHGTLRDLIRIRDQICRTPWCNAPIKHADHVKPVREGGKTTEPNGQGLCEACNHIKETPGWRHRVASTGIEQHTTEITTPTGHVLQSRAPAPPRPPPEPHWVQVEPGRWILAA